MEAKNDPREMKTN